MSYLPYGQSREENTISTDRQFTGHRKLEDSGIYHAGARFYSPVLGQFIQGDKVLFMRGSEDTDEKTSSITQDYSPYNMFKYARNNPLLYVDRDGADAVLVFDSKSVFGAGHVGMLMADAGDDWHYYSWAPSGKSPLHPKKRINVNRVPESFSYFTNDEGESKTIDPTANLDAFNTWLHETSADDGKPISSGSYDKMVYINGDFSASVVEAYERTQLNKKANMLNPRNWYNVFNRNCLHECLSLIQAGRLDESYGEGAISSVKNNGVMFLSAVLRVPNLAYSGVLQDYFQNPGDMQIFGRDVMETSDLQSLLMRDLHSRAIPN